MVIKLPRVVRDLVYEAGKPILSLSLVDEIGRRLPLIVDDLPVDTLAAEIFDCRQERQPTEVPGLPGLWAFRGKVICYDPRDIDTIGLGRAMQIIKHRVLGVPHQNTSVMPSVVP
jgi:hypothetical protein